MRASSFRRSTWLTCSAICAARGGCGCNNRANTSRNCGTVNAGIFSPQPALLQLQKPQRQQRQGHVVVPLGREGQDPQRHSLIDWAVMFAKPGGWRQVRSYLIWCKCEREGAPPCVAVRVELFSQVRRAGLADLGHRRFVSLCEMYGIGQKERAGGKRVVELTADFLIEVREGAAEDVLTGGR